MAPVVVVDDKDKLGVSGQQQITFVNSGNRDAAVTGITLVLLKLTAAPSANSQCNEGSEVANLVYELVPFIIAPGEISVKTFDRTLFPELWKTDNANSNLKSFVLGDSIFRKGDIAFACLRLSVTTPDQVTDHALVPKHYITINDIPHNGPAASVVSFVYDSNKPYHVVRTTRTVFSY